MVMVAMGTIHTDTTVSNKIISILITMHLCISKASLLLAILRCALLSLQTKNL